MVSERAAGAIDYIDLATGEVSVKLSSEQEAKNQKNTQKARSGRKRSTHVSVGMDIRGTKTCEVKNTDTTEKIPQKRSKGSETGSTGQGFCTFHSARRRFGETLSSHSTIFSFI